MEIEHANAAWKLIDPAGSATVLHVERLHGGVSNLTYLLYFSDGSKAVMRTPPIGSRTGNAHNMIREANILSAVNPHFPQAPAVIGFTEDKSATGDQFLVMDYIPGMPLPPGAEIDLSQQQARALSENFVDLLVNLHAAPITDAVKNAFGEPNGFVLRQVMGWSRRFERIGMRNGREGLLSWLKENVPAESGQVAILHNDFKFDNMILCADNPTQIVGVLDWELSGLGDPFMDLGNALAYWMQASDPQALLDLKRGPTDHPGMMTRDEIIDAYCKRRNLQRPITMSFYQVMGLFRLAVIALQVHMRMAGSVEKTTMFLSGAVLLLDRAESLIGVD